jgi:hypothetical protein
MSIHTFDRKAKFNIAAIAAVIFSSIIVAVAVAVTAVILSTTGPASAGTSVTGGTNPSPAASSSGNPWN